MDKDKRKSWPICSYGKPKEQIDQPSNVRLNRYFQIRGRRKLTDQESAQAIEEAVKITDAMSEHKDWTLQDIAVECVSLGMHEKALNLALNIKGHYKTDALEKISYGFIEADRSGLAFQALNNMEKGHQSRDVGRILIKKYAEAGQYNKAEEAAVIAKFGYGGEYAYYDIAVHLAGKGELEKALGYVEKMRDRQRKAMAFAALGAIVIKPGPPNQSQ